MAGQSRSSSSAAPTTLGRWLRQARTGQNLAIKDVAARIAADQSHLGKYERDVRLPPLSMAEDLAEAYRVPVADVKKRILARRLLDDCDGDAALVRGAIGVLEEEAAAYGVNKPANNLSAPPPPAGGADGV